MKIPKAKKLASGRWNIQVMVDGRRVSITENTEKEAIAAAAKYKVDAAEPDKKKAKLSLIEAIDIYVDSKENTLSPSTIRGYETIKKHRFKQLMNDNVYAMKKADVQKAVNKESKLCSPKTVANAYGLVRSVLKFYEVDVFGVKLPQQVKPLKKYLQPEDIGKLIDAIKGDKCEIPILLAVWLGMRRSEISGLCWDCVDQENGIIHIRRRIIPDKNNHWIMDDGAKNQTSQRSIQCPDYIMDKIKVLPTREGRLFKMSPETIRKHVHAACKRAGIVDTTVHGLRHTNAAVMKTLGIDDRHAMARGGWSCESTYRKTYSYVFECKANEADTQINSFFADKIADDKNSSLDLQSV